MAKQNLSQFDLYDYKYIEDQVAKIKARMENKETNDEPNEMNEHDVNENTTNEQNIYEMLKVQQLLLEDIKQQLSEMSKKPKRRWGKF